MSDQSTEDIKAMLRRQNEQMRHQSEQIEHIIWQVVGNPSHGIEGLKPSVARIEKEINTKLLKFSDDVNDMKEWRDSMWKIDLKKVVTIERVNTVTRLFLKGLLLALVGGGGGAALFQFLIPLLQQK